MTILSNYIIPILELVTLIIELIMFFTPSKPSITIDTGNKYYFENNTNINLNASHAKENDENFYFKIIFALILSYLFYSLVGKYMITIIIALTFLKMVRYHLLGIAYKRELIIPILLSFMFCTLNFLPDTVKNFWLTNHKIDISQLTGIQRLLNALTEPLQDIVTIFINFRLNINDNVSIIGTLLLVTATMYNLLKGTFQLKQNIKITTKRNIIINLIGLTIIYGLVFYSVSWNPIRKIIEAIIYFYTH
nr:hypothetical protein [Streptococcus gallolyticus]